VINIVLWAGGLALAALGVWRVRRPYARMSELDQLAENARRYESWRGNRGLADDRTSGADVMRQMMRREVIVWGAVAIVGIVLVVAGFAIR
jgi:hypothetical protein